MSAMKKHRIFLAITLLSMLFTGCKYDFILPVEVPPVESGVKFSTQVAPIFNTNDKCTFCHKPGGQSPDLTTANAYNQIVPNYVNLDNDPQSKIYSIPAPTTSTHTHKKYTAEEAAIVLKWIEEGALNN
jgi:hypothetical protein